ncbi:MAG: PrsW family glutamic-type intramembrane protease [Burkholderiales bacterium]
MEPQTVALYAAEVPPQKARAYQYVLVTLLALFGGVLGIIGAAVQELQATPLFILLLFIGAPIIEEALKPSGVYIALIRWPQALRSQLFTAVLTALSGLVFGIIESIVYVTVYVDDPSEAFVAYRFSVTLVLHAGASFLVGLGINYRVIDWAQGRAPLAKSSRNYYIAACVLHGAYNTIAFALAIAGVLDFD